MINMEELMGNIERLLGRPWFTEEEKILFDQRIISIVEIDLSINFCNQMLADNTLSVDQRLDIMDRKTKLIDRREVVNVAIAGGIDMAFRNNAESVMPAIGQLCTAAVASANNACNERIEGIRAESNREVERIKAESNREVAKIKNVGVGGAIGAAGGGAACFAAGAALGAKCAAVGAVGGPVGALVGLVVGGAVGVGFGALANMVSGE